MRAVLTRWLGRRPRVRLLTRRMASCVLVGLVAGFGACLFYLMLTAGLAFFLGVLCRYVPVEAGGEPSPFGWLLDEVPRHPLRWLLLLMPALGGIASGWLVFTFAPEAEGHGTDSAILAFHRLGGRIRARVPVLKMIASALTIGTGGSGGREGPIAQIGAGFGSFLGTKLKLPDRERRLLMLAGLGAGVGAIFKAPLAGAIFAGEVLYAEEELEYEALIPATVASIVSYAVFVSFFGTSPIFITPEVAFTNPFELVGYGLLGVVCAAGGWLYVKCFYGTRDLFHKLAIRPHWKPALGGLLTGLVGFFFPAALATGYGQVQRALNLDPTLTVGFLIALAVLKIATTSFSIGSGGSGGVFGPAMVIGGALGGATGLVCQRLGLLHDASAMVVVGMAGFWAGAANTPLSTIIMVSEITGNYDLLVPSMCTCTIAAVLLRRHGIYENQVANRQSSAAHSGELAVDILQVLRVDDWMNREQQTIPVDLPLPALVVHMADALHTRHVVVDDEGLAVGILDVRDVLCVVKSDQPEQITAADLMDRHFSTILRDHNLHEALIRLDQDTHGMLVVVKAVDDLHVSGVLRRQDVLHAYHHVGDRMLQSVHRDQTGAVHIPSDVTVGEAMTLEYDGVPPEMSLDDLARMFQESGHHGCPVVDDQGYLYGIVTLTDLQLAAPEPGQTVLDICTREVVTCFPFETLVEALRKFDEKHVGRLPVVDPAEPGRLVGLLRRGDVMNALAHAAALDQQDEELAVVHALDVPQSRFLEFTIRTGSPALGHRVCDLHLPADCLLVSIRRGPALLVPHGDTELIEGDRVTVLCTLDARRDVTEKLGRHL